MVADRSDNRGALLRRAGGFGHFRVDLEQVFRGGEHAEIPVDEELPQMHPTLERRAQVLVDAEARADLLLRAVPEDVVSDRCSDSGR